MSISVDNRLAVVNYAISDFINAMDLRNDQFGRITFTYNSTNSVAGILLMDDGSSHVFSDGETWSWPITGHSRGSTDNAIFILPVDFLTTETPFDVDIDCVFNSVRGVDEDILYFLDY